MTHTPRHQWQRRRDLGLGAGTEQLVAEQVDLHQATAARVQRAQHLMHALRAQGVPALAP